MTVDTTSKHESHQFLQHLEIVVNVVNHALIAFVTIYMTWFCLRTDITSTSLHAWLCTIGFGFLMAEGIMSHYSGNVLTLSCSRNTKTTVHWVLQALGGGCGVAGVIVQMAHDGLIFGPIHANLGFAAFILCLVSMLSGLSALFAAPIKRLLNPLLNKTFHNFVGLAAFVVALVTQFYGYDIGFFSHKVTDDFQIMMKTFTLIVIVLSSIGPLKALYHKTCNIIENCN